jgi:dTDP-4-dehydrorhamnose 3,5-epimerase
MHFTETLLAGAYLVELQPHRDERGFFARAFCAREFAAHGLNPHVEQANLSYNHRRGTVRGMHYQVPPALESKFIRCLRGAILDVVVDLRPESPTYLQHVSVELSADDRRALYVPGLFAHGFQTLADDTEVLYQVGSPYAPEFERGARYDDPAFDIDWPLPVSVISEKDLAWSPYRPEVVGS